MATNSIIEKVSGTDSSSNRIASTFYCTCSTAAATAQKDATPSDSCVFNNSCLLTGVTVHVKFTNSNTHATPTLKVGTATAKQIMKYGTTKPGTTAATSWQAGSVISFTYDGTYWQMNDYSAINALNPWELAVEDNGVMNTNKTITIPTDIWEIANEFNIIVIIKKSTSYSGTFTFNVPKRLFGWVDPTMNTASNNLTGSYYYSSSY